MGEILFLYDPDGNDVGPAHCLLQEAPAYAQSPAVQVEWHPHDSGRPGQTSGDTLACVRKRTLCDP